MENERDSPGYYGHMTRGCGDVTRLCIEGVCVWGGGGYSLTRSIALVNR